MIIFVIFLLSIAFYFINNFFEKFLFLNNYKGEKHQKFLGSKNIPLSGGIFLIISIITIFFLYDYSLITFIFLIFCVGFFSDINLLSSPKLRLLMQSLIILLFVFFLDIGIKETKIVLLDNMLVNTYFRYFFTTFCLLILINGSNFIDGLNGLLISYFGIIFAIIFYLNFYIVLSLEKELIILFVSVLIYLFLLNINNKLFMGDSGSYSLSLLCGYFLIKIYEHNQEISPFFIVLLLWYPCFENLFSIIRKFSLKKSPVTADSNHLHQLVFVYFKKKDFVKYFSINNISSFVIILYNIMIFLISLYDPANTQLQIILILLNIFIYLLVYFKLFSLKYNLK